MSFEVEHVSKAELGQLRPPSVADIQRGIDRASWDQDRLQAYHQLMAEITRNAGQFAKMQQSPAPQQAPMQTNPDRLAPAATPRHEPVTDSSYSQARGRSVTEKPMHTPSITHLPANVQQAMRRNEQRDNRQMKRQQTLQRLTDRTKGAMRVAGNTLLGRWPVQDRAQRTRLEDLQAKKATDKRVEQQAQKGPTVFDKYLSKQPERQAERHQGKEHERGRDRTR